MHQPIPSSFDTLSSAVGERGQRVHPQALEHSKRLQPAVYTVLPKVWCVVGNGLSNQTFVEAPDGLIAIDTGECVEEMAAALRLVRPFTQAPVIACIYTHFHYVTGTRALLDDGAPEDLPIYAHAAIEANLRRFGGEAAPRYSRGLVHQFGIVLPDDGPDSVENVGLGLSFRNPMHAPYTPGYLPATHLFDKELKAAIGGLRVEMWHAPSDADDSITIWFPELNLAINNLLWPALFNVFALRGEAYRDPRILINGLDQLRGLQTDYLLGAHGPPLVDAQTIDQTLMDYRDAIQFLWDQTVRGANEGLSLEQLTERVQLPPRFERTFYTQQFYGLVEHHIRQIYTGLFGWFDEDPAKLFPPPPRSRARRLIEGFGGVDTVREQINGALESHDYRWALELSNWLVQVHATSAEAPAEDKERLASALRGIAYCTTSANVRNWCLTRALEVGGEIDLQRFRKHVPREREVLASDSSVFVEILRVMLDPHRAGDLDECMAWHFDDGSRVGLHLRGGVAVPDNGASAGLTITLTLATWARIMSNKQSVETSLSTGEITVTSGSKDRVSQFLGAFDHPAFLTIRSEF